MSDSDRSRGIAAWLARESQYAIRSTQRRAAQTRRIHRQRVTAGVTTAVVLLAAVAGAVWAWVL